jgi:hypothetical protein
VDVSANYDVPGSIQIGTNRTPSKADVEEAVSELSNAAAPVLEADRDISLLLVRDLKVKKVRTTGDSGWAEIQARSAIELEPGGTWRKVKVPNQRWELRRGGDGWSVFLPDGRVFIAQSAAIPILARRLPTGSVGSARAAEADGMRALVTLLRKENPQRER